VIDPVHLKYGEGVGKRVISVVIAERAFLAAYARRHAPNQCEFRFCDYRQRANGRVANQVNLPALQQGGEDASGIFSGSGAIAA